MNNPPSSVPHFRYREYLERLSEPCPPEYFEPRETTAFRWVFEDLENEQNFIPQFFKSPKRFFHKAEAEKCKGLGLSFFNSIESANAQFAELKKRLNQMVFRMGTHLAQGIIHPDMGLADEPNRNGHFTFHPFEEIELKNHFVLIAPL